MTIATCVENGIGSLRINRPSTRNAISQEMWDAIPQALVQLKRDGAGVIVISGTDEAFASGADLCELEQIRTESQARSQWSSIRTALNAVASFELPVIAAIQGTCFGGGCLLAIACDLRYSADNARFAVPVAQLGILLDQDNIIRLLALVGRGVCSEMLLTAQVLDAQRAREVGLVNAVVPAAELAEAVQQLSERTHRNAAPSLVAAKAEIRLAIEQLVTSQDQSAVIASYLSPEFRSRVGKALKK